MFLRSFASFMHSLRSPDYQDRFGRLGHITILTVMSKDKDTWRRLRDRYSM